jgi:hypothetical protein
MKMKSLTLSVALGVFMLSNAPVWAQTSVEKNECFIEPTEITKIREPLYGSLSVWDYIEQGDGLDSFSDVIPLPDKGYAAFGSFTKNKEDKIYHPLIVRFDENLKKVWEVRTLTTDFKTIHRAQKIKDGYAVFGDIQTKTGNGVYIGFYTEDGKVKAEIPFYEKGGNLDAKGLVLASDDTGYVAAAQFINGKDQTKQHGVLYKISKDGKLLWKRSYDTGNATIFQNLQPTLDGRYLVSGQIVFGKNKNGAWLLRVDNKGSIGWQQIYQRGEASSLRSVAHMKDGSYLAVGKSRPLNGDKNLAAWVMKTDQAGNPIWQRYFRGPYNYEGADVAVYEDGRSKVLFNAQGSDNLYRSHARLMTFSSDGKVLDMEDFTEGQNANAQRLVVGLDGEHLTAGFTQTSFAEDPESDNQIPVYTFDGWLRAGVPLENHENPCAENPDLSPILP